MDPNVNHLPSFAGLNLSRFKGSSHSSDFSASGRRSDDRRLPWLKSHCIDPLRMLNPYVRFFCKQAGARVVDERENMGSKARRGG